MTGTLFAIVIVALYSAALFGWGLIALRVTANEQQHPFSYTLAVGIAALIFLGGILNAAGLAYSKVLLGLLIVGWITAFHFLVTEIQQHENRATILSDVLDRFSRPTPETISYILLALLSIFLIHNLLPSQSFNFHDDYHTYIPRIEAMAAMGTLGGNPLALIGVDSLGAQQYMQAFVTSVFGFRYVNGFDAVLCMIVSCALVIQLAKLVNAPWFVGLSGMLVVLLINAQQVNVSSVYSTTALALALSYAAVLANRQSADSLKAHLLRLAPAILICSALIALKLMTAIFAALFFLLLVLLPGASGQQSLAERVKLLVASGAVLTAVTAPWFLVHASNYWTALMHKAGDSSAFANSINASSNLERLSLGRFFSSQELFWGGSYFGYNAMFLLLAAAFAWLLLRSGDERRPPDHCAAAAVAGAAALSYAFGLLVFEPDMALRYSIPFLIASVAATSVILFARPEAQDSESAPTASTASSGWAVLASIAVLQALLLYSFSDSFLRRLNVVRQYQATLMFPLNDTYRQYMQVTFSRQRAQAHLQAQGLCPAGRGTLTWVSTAFLFDHTRNNIYNFASPAVLTPWFTLPTDGDTEALRKALIDMGIECIIWEHKGFGMKSHRQHVMAANSGIHIQQKLGQRVLALRKALAELAISSAMKYNKDGLVVIDVTAPNAG